jgi:CheY-like chemotaxis protein
VTTAWEASLGFDSTGFKDQPVATSGAPLFGGYPATQNAADGDRAWSPDLPARADLMCAGKCCRDWAVVGCHAIVYTNAMIRVMLADDHSFLRARIADVVGSERDMRVVGECSDGLEVVAVAQMVRPHLVLMDVRMPFMSGPVATRALLSMRPLTKVVMLTSSMDSQLVEESRASGAVGYLLKDGSPGRLVEAIRLVAAGGTTWPTDSPPLPTG